MHKNKLTTGQLIVLSQHLSYWPHNHSFNDITHAYLNDAPDVDVWDAFSDWDKTFFINHLTSLAHDIDSAIAKEIACPRI